MFRSDVNTSPWNLLLFVGVGLTAFTNYQRVFPGGHVLVMQVILCIFAVAPVIFIQLKLGGLVQKSVFGLFHSSLPVLRGAAVALLVHVLIIGTYMPALAVHSICAGFATVSSERQLMTSCKNEWNTDKCYEPRSGSRAGGNYTFTSHVRKTPLTEYMENHFYQTSGTVDDLGGFPDFPTFPLVLLLTWVFIFLLVAFGPRVFAWAVSVMGLVSTVIMIGVLVHGWLVDAGRGRREHPTEWLSYFYAPSFSSMGKINDWLYALLQLTWVTKVSIGILPSMGKLTGKGRVSRNLSWFLVVSMHLVFTHLPVLTIAPYQYSAAREQGVPFTAYPLYNVDVESAVAIFVYGGAHPAASFFYFLAGYVHYVAQLALFVLVILDNFFDAFEGWAFSSDSKRRVSWIIASAVMCAIMFLLGLPYMTRGGISLLQFFESSTDTLYPITWYCAGLGLLAIYVRQKTVAFAERVIIVVWLIIVILAWTVIRLYRQLGKGQVTIIWLFDPLPRKSRSKWFSFYWLTAVFPVLLIVIGVFLYFILSLIQRRQSRNFTLHQPESRDFENRLLTEKAEAGNTAEGGNIELVSQR